MIGTLLVGAFVLLLAVFLKVHFEKRGSLEKLGIPVVPSFLFFGKLNSCWQV